jgi:ABC-type Fe3+-hydroxamate transport system substrate-binding protein
MLSRVISFRLSLVLLLSVFVLLTACGQSSSPTTGVQPTAAPTPALDVYGTPIVFPVAAQRFVSAARVWQLHLSSKGIEF